MNVCEQARNTIVSADRTLNALSPSFPPFSKISAPPSPFGANNRRSTLEDRKIMSFLGNSESRRMCQQALI